MNKDLTWLSDMGLDIDSALGYTGGQDRYLSAIKRFYDGYEKNRNNIEHYLENADIESYMITVHALKSNSKMIGASSLGALFEALETAARNNDTVTIGNDTFSALKAYKELVEKLSPVGALGDFKAADEISGEVAKETARKLLDALDDFDDDLSKELIKKLSGYPFRMSQKEILKEAAGYIDDFLYDEAMQEIKKIIPSIE